MSKSIERRWAGRLVALISIAAVSVVTGGTRASAAPAPVLPPPQDMPSADGLPTVQIDGVVWSQAVVGNTVYAGGRFNNARPAGAAAGTQLTQRGNLLAYDITTGNLVTSFAPNLNGQVMSVAASPDGSRIYVVGSFTTANGQSRQRVAAYSTATGALITAFNPVGVASQARAVVATNDTVYVGGGFGNAGSQVRRNLVAFRASDGALLNWNPDADYTVWALAKSTDGSAIFAGGSFQNVGGQPAYGLAKINATSGAVMPWNVPNTVRNAGNDAGITSLKVRGDFVYGTTWVFGPGGNHEGVFKAPAGSGDVEWLTNCHGDNYSTFPANGVIYSVGHAHYCGNVGGGFPQYPEWRFQHTQAWTDTAGGEILNNPHGGSGPNWHGVEPAPSMINWLPEMAVGSFTGQFQAGWDVSGTNDYVVVGGEFPRVNGVNQQGLVRFARRSLLAPQQRQQGPRFLNNEIVPTLVPTSPTSVRVSWLAGFDRDDYSLQYDVFRADVSPARYTTAANSNWWTTPSLGFVDTGLTPGQTYTYRIVVRDSDNHVVNGATRNVTMPSSVPTNAYASRVRADGARLYWPLNEPVLPTPAQIIVTDRAGVSDGRSDNGVTWGHPGAIAGDTAARLTTTNEFSRVFTRGTETAPDLFSAQVWIRTTTTTGGRILGFGDLQTGNSGHRDRHIYMNNAGQLNFGVRAQNNSVRTLTSARAYNDNQWHQVTATMDGGGMRLYIDGAQVGSRTDTTQGEAYLGNWRVGGDNLAGWPNAPGNVNFVNGYVDEVAIYPTALSLNQIVAQYDARNGTTPPPPINQPPVAAFTATPNGLSVNVDGTGSSDPGGSIAGYSWNWGDGTVASTGSTASHTYATAGTYTLTLTVTDNQGATDTEARQVTVTAGNQPPVAAFTATPNGLSVNVDGTGSSDPGGSIAGYSWNWGDGTVASTGSTASHTFAAAGTYTLTLTVTDNQGATDTEARQVTVTAGNQPPVAAFTATPNGLSVNVDGTGSSDPGGSIAGYSWNWGDGTVASTGSTASHTFAAAGTYTLTLTVTDNQGATDTEARQVTVTAGNQPPVAAFTATPNGLSVNVDGTGSSDPGGSIAGYSWNWGDGTVASTGSTASHTFAAAGTYTLTLTVTDNQGATDTEARQVTVTAGNQPPVAAFTATPNGLSVNVDGTGSSDPGGSIAGYSWNWGDGTVASTGSTASHTFAAAGTYTVTLTVTDNQGATDTESTQVTVAASQPVALDTFTRTAANGFGAADVGGTWTVTLPASISADGSAGRVSVTPGSGPSAFLNTVSVANVDATVDIESDKVGTGGGIYQSLIVRRVGTSDYRLKVRITATTVEMYLVRTVNGTETTLAAQTVPGLVYQPGMDLHLRLRATGAGPATLQGRLWTGAQPEPATWNVTTTDATAALQGPGAVGLFSYLSGSATNPPVTIGIDNLDVRAL